jgi:glycosyltransferase involved in cell wall biosynthesis
MPKVSVMMSAYNDKGYVSMALESLLGQTFESFEIIIVEDASSD